MKELRKPRIYEGPPCGSIFLISRERDLLAKVREKSLAAQQTANRRGAGETIARGKFVKRRARFNYRLSNSQREQSIRRSVAPSHSFV